MLKVRGPKGTTVKLLVLHQNQTKPVEISIVRDDIATKSVSMEMKGEFALIRISNFSETTDAELIPVLNDVINRGAKGIILDLRSDPGGLLETVVNVTSHFLRNGIVLSVTDNQGRTSTTPVRRVSPVTDLPMVVLVDAYSASGSEVLSGALQDYNRATIAGTKTFGKGSVNILRQLSDGSGIYISTARWYTPNGNLIEGKGITPNIELTQTGDDAVNWAIDYLKKK